MKASIFNLLSAVTLLLASFLLFNTVSAQDVRYINAYGVEKTLSDGSYTVVSSDAPFWADGWYVVNGVDSIADRITVSGEVHLILTDGCHLKAGKGIKVEEGNTIHIYGQSAQTGQLTATGGITRTTNMGDYGGAGIGGDAAGTGGTIEVNGGVVTAVGGRFASGIGGGAHGHDCGEYGHAGTFIINGGSVTATGSSYAAGIGGGGDETRLDCIYPGNGGTAIFNGGHVTANGGYGCYGVGPGRQQDNSRIGYTGDLTLNWRHPDDSYYISNALVHLTLANDFVTQDGSVAVTADNFTGTTIVPASGTLHTVTFMADGELFFQPEVLDGHTIADPGAPKIGGKKFIEWQLNGERYDFSTPVTEDITLVAELEDHSVPFADGAYQLSTPEHWKNFAEIVAEETNSANAVLVNDIELGSDAPMIGSSAVHYCGTFDGQGHTLTVNFTASGDDGVAPFQYVSGAKFSNLTIAGNINSGVKYAAGYAVHALSTEFTGCVSSVTITSTVNGDGTHGGFVALTDSEGSCTFTRCIVNGQFLGTSTNSWGGFVGWSSGETHFTGCLFAPSQIDIDGNGCHTFCRGTVTSVENCYYTQAIGTAAGEYVQAIVPGERVTITAMPAITFAGKNYYTSPATLILSYDLPDGMYFRSYSVSNGSITNPSVIDGEHVVSDFTGEVAVSGRYVESLVDISTVTIADIPAQTYTMEPLEPEPVLMYPDTLLIKGVDYTVSWADNVMAGENTAKCIITGLGMFTGSTTKAFTISPCDLASDVITMGMQRTFKYDHNSHKPEVTVYHNDSQLTEGTDYEVHYPGDFIEEGDYEVIVTGKGNYTGIVKQPLSIINVIYYLAYDEEKGKFISKGNDIYDLVIDQTELTSGWWYVADDVALDTRLRISGNVNLIVSDGITFRPSKGISVEYDSTSNNSLTIYAQSQGEEMGRIVINDVSDADAGIGGTNRGIGGRVRIDGGNIEVSGGESSAAIGSAASQDDVNWDEIIKQNKSDIEINGGNIKAIANYYGAAIGGGLYTTGGTITINGGTIYAAGGYNSAGIGGGGGEAFWENGGAGGTIVINGGNITAIPEDEASAIGDALNPVGAGDDDCVKIAWADVDNDRLTLGGNIGSQSVEFVKNFSIRGTKLLATVDNCGGHTLLPAEKVVTFDSDGGTTVPSQALRYGDVLNYPADPVKEGETFVEWQFRGERFDMNTPITLNLTLKAAYGVFDTVPLEQLLDATTPDDTMFIISEPVGICDYSITDKDGIHSYFIVDDDETYAMITSEYEYEDVLSSGFLAKKTTNGNDVTLTLVNGKSGDDWYDHIYDIERMSLKSGMFEPKHNQVVNVKGFYQYADGHHYVSHYSGDSGEMGEAFMLQTSYVDFASDEMTPHQAYWFIGAYRPASTSHHASVHKAIAESDGYCLLLLDGNPMPAPVTAVETIVSDEDEVVRETYYNLQGIKLYRPAEGINIIVVEKADGTIETRKVIR